MANKCNHDMLDDFSSRIKKVFIELNDYYFYHGPSDENFGDHRIIGRKKLLRKIQALFTNSEYAAGVYLVTGYRGSGKTSLINKVISSIDSNLKLLKGNPVSYLYAMILFIVLTFFSYLLASAKRPDQITSVKPHLIIFIFGSILLLFSAAIILRAKLKKYNGFSDYYSKSTWRIQNGIEKLRILNLFPDSSQKIVKKILTITLKVLFIPFELLKVFLIKEYYYNYRLNKWFIINWLFIVLFPFIFSSSFYLLFFGVERVDYYQYIRTVFLIFYAELGINIIINIFEPFEKDDPNQSVPQQINSYWQCLKKRLLTILNLNRYIFIKLNLGYTSLKEIDILRLLARSLKTEINKYYKRKFIFIRFFINVFIFYLMYVIAFLFYYQNSIYKNHIAIKETLGIKYLLPSQQDKFLIRNSDSCQTLIFADINEKIYLISKFESDYQKSSPIIQNNNIYQHKTIVEYIWEKVSNTVQYSIMMLDGFIYVGYSHFRELLFKGCFLNIAGSGYLGGNNNDYYYESFTPIPKHLDYFFILYIILIYQIIRRLIISRIFKVTSPRLVMKMVNELNEIIISEITTENIGIGKEKSGFNLVSFLSPRSRKRTIADVREIEKYLIEILDEIDKIRFPFSKPHITVVLDELDKIETHTQAIFSRKTENSSNHDGTNSFSKIPNPSFTIDSTRERQQTLQLLLSNLKYFLGDAKAKFVFIAGREMFDASLADISDRNYFMGSIFHDVIYVDSFFCDDLDEKPSDITSMIEYYVCQFLIPHNYRPSQNFQDHKAPFNLRTFNQYILDTFPEFNEHARGLKVADKIIARQKREKVISIIQQFIIYLTHASNGAPKKITNYFENFVEFRVLEKEYAANQILLTTFNDYHRKEHPYLVFNYNKQYEIGLINYITVPIVLSINTPVKI